MEPKSGRRAVAQTSPPPDGFAAANKSAVSRVSKPAGRSISRIAPIWKSAIQQVWKTALQYWGRLGFSRRDLSLSDYASRETGYGARGRLQFNPAQHASREWTRVAFSKNQGNSVRQERRFHRHAPIRSGSRTTTREFAAILTRRVSSASDLLRSRRRSWGSGLGRRRCCRRICKSSRRRSCRPRPHSLYLFQHLLPSLHSFSLHLRRVGNQLLNVGGKLLYSPVSFSFQLGGVRNSALNLGGNLPNVRCGFLPFGQWFLSFI